MISCEAWRELWNSKIVERITALLTDEDSANRAVHRSSSAYTIVGTFSRNLDMLVTLFTAADTVEA